KRVLACGGAYPGWMDVMVDPTTIEIRNGQFTATELLAYFRSLQSLRTDPGVWAIEPDFELNRIWIGLGNAAANDRIRAAVVFASVPIEAVSIKVPPTPTGSEAFDVV